MLPMLPSGLTWAVAVAPAPVPPSVMLTCAVESVNGLLAQFGHGPK
jgi:hypothetical protein